MVSCRCSSFTSIAFGGEWSFQSVATVSREFKKTTTATSCRTPPNNSFNEQPARAKYNLANEKVLKEIHFPSLAVPDFAVEFT